MEDKWLIVFVSSGVSALLTIFTSRILFLTNKKHELRERIFNSLKESIQQAETTILETTLLLSVVLTNVQTSSQNNQNSLIVTERNDFFRLISDYHKHLNEIIIWFNLYQEKRTIFKNNNQIRIVLNKLIEDMKHDFQYLNDTLDKIDSVLKKSNSDTQTDVINEFIQVIESYKVSNFKTEYSQSLKDLMTIMYKGMKL